MDIKPIKSERDYREALRVAETLWGAKAGTPEANHLEVLTVLIDDYEKRTTPMGRTDAVAAIEFHMEQTGHDRTALGKVLGASSGRVSEILNGKRRLTVDMIRALHEKWGIPLESLVQKPKKRRRASSREARA